MAHGEGTTPRRGSGRGSAPVWLLAVPLVLAAGAVLWLFVGSSLFGPTAGAGSDGLDAEEAAAAEAAASATLAGTNRPRVEKPAMKEEEEDGKPTFTKGEGVFGRVIDSREKPIPGAKVNLFVPDASNPWTPLDGPPRDHGRGGGRDLPPGAGATARLRVRAEAPGYASTTQLISSRGARVDLILDRAGTLKVKVKNRKGEPVKDAEVKVSAGWMVQAPPVKTNEAGEALVEGLASGSSNVRVSAVGFGPVNLSDVQVEPAKVTERSIVMGRGLPVSGRVTDETTSQPVEGAEVFAKVQWDQSALKSDTVKTDADGKFKLESAGGQGE